MTARGATAPRLLGTAEAAEYLGVHTRTLQEWVSQGRIHCLRVGRHLRFRIADLDGWAEGRRVPNVQKTQAPGHQTVQKV